MTTTLRFGSVPVDVGNDGALRFRNAYVGVIDDIGADSLDVVELIMSLEDNYGISISDDDAAKLLTVEQITAYLENQQ